MTEETKTQEENVEQDHAKMETEKEKNPSALRKWTKRIVVGGVVLSAVTAAGFVINKVREIEVLDI